MNLYPVTVVENFYENPDEIRAFALKQSFQYCHEQANIDYVYPGCRTQDLIKLNSKLYEKICKKLVSVFHNAEHDYMRWVISTSFQSVGEIYKQGVIHCDDNTVFAAVLYLTPNAPLNAGTSLFKPNASFNANAYQQALNDNDVRFKAGEIIMRTDYHSMFDEIVRVNNVYNTLILYEGQMHHAANHFFGNDLENSRLAQVFFVSRVDAQKHSSFPLHRTKSIQV
jgi:Family of unknown function (DUF6445)